MILFALTAAVLAAFQWSNEKKGKPRDANFRDVHGVVTLPDGSPAERAVVELKDMRTKQVRSYITQTDGKYIYTHLSVKVDFELVARYKGMSSARRSLTIFDTRIDPVMNLQLEAAPETPAAGKAAEQKQ